MSEPDVVSAVVSTGLVPLQSIDELRRWGLFHNEEAAEQLRLCMELQPLPSRDEIGRRVERALSSKEFSSVKITDLDIIDEFLDTARTCSLCIADGEDKDVSQFLVGKTKFGEFILPWHDDAEHLIDVLTNGMSHIVVDDLAYYFKDVFSVYFGQKHAFLLCVPSGTTHKVESSEQ